MAKVSGGPSISRAIPTWWWSTWACRSTRARRRWRHSAPRSSEAVQPRLDGLLFHQLFVFELLPLHVGIRQYWRD